MAEKPFVHLHNHSDSSLLDGAQKCFELAGRAKEIGHSAVAITDHGTMRGFYKFHLACKDADIKPIYGFEAYMCEDRFKRGLSDEERERVTSGIKGKRDQNAAIRDEERRLGIRSREHACFFAKTNVGLQNLFRLSSVGWLDGFYYRPRIDMESIVKYKQDLVMSTACLDGPLCFPYLRDDIKGMIRAAEVFHELFGDDFYVEIMPHALPDQVRVNLALVALATKMGYPIIATNDAHYAKQEHAQRHEVLLCMQDKTVWSNPKRWRFDGTSYYLQTHSEMVANFQRNHPDVPLKVVEQALETTLEVAEKCNASLHIDRKQCLLPPVEIKPDHWPQFLDWARETYPDIYTLDD